MLAIWWNTYRQAGVGDPFADRVTPLLATMDLAPSEGVRGHYSLDTEFHRDAITAAGFDGFKSHVFRRERSLSTRQVVELFASYSYVRALSERDRTSFLVTLARIANDDFGGLVPNVVLTAAYLAEAPRP